MVSKLQSPWWRQISTPRMSNGVASAGSARKTNSAPGSMWRRMSQAQAARSMWMLARVAHFTRAALGVDDGLGEGVDGGAGLVAFGGWEVVAAVVDAAQFGA
ncbi:hypothetical protein [Pseudonocardia dioxanivorans]|uniref:hypothetical protein n=1 Tax=Pseudonocardia dioxanivorans TaxID=240495 RepID=UPI0005A0EEB7|nr:hypothetical protein [Pseudonocardia dioxanivorans]